MENQQQKISVSTGNQITTAEQKQAMLSAIIANSDDVIISKTLQGIITSWNPAAERLFGYTEAETIGQHISLIIPEDRKNEEVFIMSEISNGRRVNHFETIRISKTGKLIPLSLSISPIVSLQGEVIGASKIARDITDQQQAAAENTRLYEQVKTLNEKKDEFIALASHELKTPLTSVQAYLQILSKTITDERSKGFVQKAEASVKRVVLMISELLDVSKIEAGRLKLNPETFNMVRLAAEVAEMLAHNNPELRIELIPDAEEIKVSADRHRIEQVLINFLTNAIRYAPDSNQVSIHIHQDADYIKVGVHDTGMGIPADKLENIFTKFYRVNNGSPTISGLGIGLYICKEIILQHQGEIWAESEPGVGSQFWFKLPVSMHAGNRL